MPRGIKSSPNIPRGIKSSPNIPRGIKCSPKYTRSNKVQSEYACRNKVQPNYTWKLCLNSAATSLKSSATSARPRGGERSHMLWPRFSGLPRSTCSSAASGSCGRPLSGCEISRREKKGWRLETIIFNNLKLAYNYTLKNQT